VCVLLTVITLPTINVQEFGRFTTPHADGRRVFVRAEALKNRAQNGWLVLPIVARQCSNTINQPSTLLSCEQEGDPALKQQDYRANPDVRSNQPVVGGHEVTSLDRLVQQQAARQTQ